MQPGDLITYRNTRKTKRNPPAYIVVQVNDNGSVQVTALKTGLSKTIDRPELYFVTTPSRRLGKHTSPREAH